MSLLHKLANDNSDTKQNILLGATGISGLGTGIYALKKTREKKKQLDEIKAKFNKYKKIRRKIKNKIDNLSEEAAQHAKNAYLKDKEAAKHGRIMSAEGLEEAVEKTKKQNKILHLTNRLNKLNKIYSKYRSNYINNTINSKDLRSIQKAGLIGTGIGAGALGFLSYNLFKNQERQ
jgi:uncharacterized coiled-coil DUF342 family protein